jgi:hypothetical protein
MANTPYALWCYVEGDNTIFCVTASSTTPIGRLKYLIKEKSNFLQGVDASNLSLMKVRYIMVSVWTFVMNDLCWLMTSPG